MLRTLFASGTAIRFPPLSVTFLVTGAVFRLPTMFFPTAANATAAPKPPVAFRLAGMGAGDRRVEVTWASILSCRILAEPDGAGFCDGL